MCIDGEFGRELYEYFDPMLLEVETSIGVRAKFREGGGGCNVIARIAEQILRVAWANLAIVSLNFKDHILIGWSEFRNV